MLCVLCMIMSVVMFIIFAIDRKNEDKLKYGWASMGLLGGTVVTGIAAFYTYHNTKASLDYAAEIARNEEYRKANGFGLDNE